MNLLAKAADLENLRRAWHLARADSYGDFAQDSHRYSDFGHRLDDYLQSIRQSMLSGSYPPSPIIPIDVPKTALAVRPASTIRIEDRIALFAVVLQIAPTLDALLPENVYSYRLKDKPTLDSIFDNTEVLKYTYLKNKTVRKRVDIVLPWYHQWPKFRKAVLKATKKESYRYLLVTDIASYFENIEIQLLQEFLIERFPEDREALNIMTQCLRFWSWGPRSGSSSARGIPQGNAISSFLGNVFLHPVDIVLSELERKGEVRYFRYVDDIEVLAKSKRSARETLQKLNQELRHLRLTIQGSKTRILEGRDIELYLHDPRLERTNNLIKRVASRKTLAPSRRTVYLRTLRATYAELRGSNPASAIGKEADERLFRRLMTAFTVFGHDEMVPKVLETLNEGRDAKFIDSAMGYLTAQEKRSPGIPVGLFQRLTHPDGILDYEVAGILKMLRYSHLITPAVISFARDALKERPNDGHWYIAQQAAALLSTQTLHTPDLRALLELSREETDECLRRALALPLAQLPTTDFSNYVDQLSVEPFKGLQRLGVFLRRLATSEPTQRERLDVIFQTRKQFDETGIADSLYEIDIIVRHGNASVRRRAGHLCGTYALICKRAWLRKRLLQLQTTARIRRR